MYPVMLNVTDQRCLVVGGGDVALRKVHGLLSEGARLTVVARAPVNELRELARDGAIGLAERDYQAGEAAGFALVIAATDDRSVNRRVFDDATAAGIWVNVADDPELCTFHLPARVQRGRIQFTVSSDGTAPFVVRRLRQRLERTLDAAWAAWSEAAAGFRRAVLERDLPTAAREQLFDRFFDSTVGHDTLGVRAPDAGEVRAWLQEVDPPSNELPEEQGHIVPVEKATFGFVSLVGGGPGDPGLLTRRGWRRLHEADAVVYDRLAATALPCDLLPGIELHDVGKRAGRHPVPQEEINALLVRLAQEGRRVVRLKGGDPFVFGRGGEEAEALVEAGVLFEVVPGVTAGVAVPAYAGIPATHRDDSVRLTLITAHESAERQVSRLRWDLLAQDESATIAGYMGVSNLPRVVEQLIAGGMAPDTPSAVVERGTTAAQRTVESPLRRLHEAVQEAGLKPPALFVIGEVVRHGGALQWFTTRPLHGERIGIAQPAGALAAPLEQAGVDLVEVPTPIPPAAGVVLDALPMTAWIFRRADEVSALGSSPPGVDVDRAAALCVGRDAAARARELGWSDVRELRGGGAEEIIAELTARR